jgi:hypothetical protein
MLSSTDRGKFEQIRSQWEAAQPVSDTPSTMVGRKERSVAEAPLTIEPGGGPGRFRRKLSHGFSLISNPLSQRRVTPIRQTSGFSLPANEPTATLDALLQRERNRLPAAARAPESNGQSEQPTARSDDNESTARSFEPDATPKPLPRSRTMSFLPRPSRSGSLAWSVESNPTDNMHTLDDTLGQTARVTSTKIPTPSPPPNERRLSSPRQHVSVLASQQTKPVATGCDPTGACTESPSKSSVRSYTTPNLMKPARSPPRAKYVAPRMPAVRNSTPGIPVPQKSALKENAMPAGHRYSKRLPQIQEASPRRESLTSTPPSRRDSGIKNVMVESKQSSATPPTASKRCPSSRFTQTPLAAQRAMPKKQSPLTPMDRSSYNNRITISQPRLMGPMNPPTPPTARLTAAQPTQPQESREKRFQKRALKTPSKIMGGRTLSGRQVKVDNEVRLPRSSTFHNLHLEFPPPVPSIPDRYKSPSMPVLFRRAHTLPKFSTIQEFVGEDGSDRTNGLNPRQPNDLLYSASRSDLDTPEQKLMEKDESWPLIDKSPTPIAPAKVRPAMPRSSSHPLMLLSPSFWTKKRTSSHPRPWPLTEHEVENKECADISLHQVKDYMPALYWAGRFQSRFDQWRTEAMKIELDPGRRDSDQAELLKLSQENAAACQIFLQLRDLCVSNQAVDSFWVCSKPHGVIS